MSRRRLQVVCSSDDEEEEPQPPAPPSPSPPQPQQLLEEEIDDVIMDIETDFQTVTLTSLNPTPCSNNSTTTANTNGNGTRPSEPIPLDISDEDEENINGDTTNNSNFGGVNDNMSYFEVSESPVNAVLERLGLRLKREWLNSCLHNLHSAVSGFHGMNDSAKAKLCFQQFLLSDMNYCGAGVLPPNVHSLHLVYLKGPFVLQVDEIANISCPLRGRYQNAAPGIKRCLKLSMTDGVQRVFGMEYRPIKDLEVLVSAGLKVAVCNVNIRHGLLMLVPKDLEVLGGTADELETARQRLVNEINKPPRGKRNRTGDVPPLATRATVAAWPQRNDDVRAHAANRNTTVNRAPLRAIGQATAGSITANNMHRQAFVTPFSRNNADPNMSAAPRPQDEVPGHTNVPASTPLQFCGQGTAFRFPANDRHREDIGVPAGTSNVEPIVFSAMQPQECVTTLEHIDETMAEVMTPSGATGQAASPGMPANCMPVEDVNVPGSRGNAKPNTSSTIHMNVEEISMTDEMENHHILPRDDEIPFTYLARLSAKCMAIGDEVSAIRGTVKCFVTGVKGFQYRQRATYELRVYVDDGSLISEILIDHTVVQKGIGYSPPEVTNALASSDKRRVSEMKETLKQFQLLLVNFEGTMLVEMKNTSPVPVAVEMNQGCPASDARLLLKRFKSLSSTQPRNSSL